MIKQILFGALSATVALGAGSAMGDDLRGQQLQNQTEYRADQTGHAAHGFVHNGGRMVRHTGGVIEHASQTTFDGAHSAEYNVRHPDSYRGDALRDRRDFRAHQTATSARMMGHATANTARDTGGVVVHGAQATGDAIHEGAHSVRTGIDGR